MKYPRPWMVFPACKARKTGENANRKLNRRRDESVDDIVTGSLGFTKMSSGGVRKTAIKTAEARSTVLSKKRDRAHDKRNGTPTPPAPVPA